MINRLASRLPAHISHGQRIVLAKLDLAYARTMRRIIREGERLDTGPALLMMAVEDYNDVLLQMIGEARKALQAENVPAEDWETS
jgi:hypothetical protein